MSQENPFKKPVDILKDSGECIIKKNDGVCSSPSTIRQIKEEVKSESHEPKKIIEDAKNKLGCDKESCVIRKLGDPNSELTNNFKAYGPFNSTELLSNHNIDGSLIQWTKIYPSFYHVSFQMIDFASPNVNSELNQLSIDDILNNGKRFMGCVINSDVTSGRGIHWMALVIDLRTPRWTVEFFNSTGNAPVARIVDWMAKMKSQMENCTHELRKHVDVIESINVTKVHQRSNTECGVYSLHYIWCRLNGVLPEDFMHHVVPDSEMIELRQYLFRHFN